MNDIRIKLADPQGHLLREIADPAMKRRDIAMSYRMAATWQPDEVDWPAVNTAIISRWSPAGLDWIKKEAWRRP